MRMLRKYIYNNLLALDRLGNAIAGGDSRHCVNAMEFEHKEIGKDNVF